VTLISSCHGEETRKRLTGCGEEKESPGSVPDYSENIKTDSCNCTFWEDKKGPNGTSEYLGGYSLTPL
jgi:hypothetical protein